MEGCVPRQGRELDSQTYTSNYIAWLRRMLTQIDEPHCANIILTISPVFFRVFLRKKEKPCHIFKGPLWFMPLLIQMSLHPSWQQATMSRVALFEVILSQPAPPLPSKISIDPNVWVLKSTTCFLMRCQGDTPQEQRTKGREPQTRCGGERLLLHWFIFSFAFFKSTCCKRE